LIKCSIKNARALIKSASFSRHDYVTMDSVEGIHT